MQDKFTEALKIENLTKYFDEKEILSNIDLSISRGEIFGFIGLNGAGKTSLIKIILNLIDPDSGDIKIFGIDIREAKSRNNIFYLPEKFQPTKNLTAFEFIKLTLNFYNKKIDQEKLKNICQIFDLEFDYLSKRIAKFSKGMSQKIGLITTFLSEADFIILDEPMSGLDVKARIALKNMIINYKKEGKTIFFTSHILPDIEEISDRIAILHKAKIAFIGNCQEFKKENKNLEEAFLKITN